jgi:hypothetical protein
LSQVLTCIFCENPQGGQHARDVPELLGTTENELGLREWLEGQGHELITTSDKEGKNSTFDKHLVDAEVIITTPYDASFSTVVENARLTVVVSTPGTLLLSGWRRPRT